MYVCSHTDITRLGQMAVSKNPRVQFRIFRTSTPPGRITQSKNWLRWKGARMSSRCEAPVPKMPVPFTGN